MKKLLLHKDHPLPPEIKGEIPKGLASAPDDHKAKVLGLNFNFTLNTIGAAPKPLNLLKRCSGVRPPKGNIYSMEGFDHFIKYVNGGNLKRCQVLGLVAHLWDPTGRISGLINAYMKLTYQKLCLTMNTKLGWNDQIDEEEQAKWRSLAKHLLDAKMLTIPRRAFLSGPNVDIILAISEDASEEGRAWIAHLRSECSDTKRVECHLLRLVSSVASLHSDTVPYLKVKSLDAAVQGHQGLLKLLETAGLSPNFYSLYILVLPGAPRDPRSLKLWEIWEHHGSTLGAPWEHHRSTTGAPWEHHGSTMGAPHQGAPWEHHRSTHPGSTMGAPQEHLSHKDPEPTCPTGATAPQGLELNHKL